MNYVRAEADYGTAGSVRNATYGMQERILVISGDVLTDFNLTEAIRFHEEQEGKSDDRPDPREEPARSSASSSPAQDGKITRFLEKPSWGEVFSDTINTGIYILEPEVLELIPYREDYDFSKDLFPLLLRQEAGLYGYVVDGYWRDIGNLNEYQEAHSDVLNGVVKVEIPGTAGAASTLGRERGLRRRRGPCRAGPS